MWCAITPERVEKTERIMKALAAGTGGTVCHGAPPDKTCFAVWGHKWLGAELVSSAHADRRPWWFVDNGFLMPARGLEAGYYSLTYRSLSPVLLEKPDTNRLAVDLMPWRHKTGGHILLALPGMDYGRMLGFDMTAWAADMRKRLARLTRRHVVVREKRSRRPLQHDLAGAAVVVTHSSKVAVDAVREGVPCIVAPTNPAAPVCSTSLDDIDNPPMPDREKWWASLMCQQFTILEMRDGTAKYWMDAIREQVDADGEVHQGFRLETAPVGDDRLQSGPRAACDDALCAVCDRKGTCGASKQAAAEAV